METLATVPIDFHSMKKIQWKSMATFNYWVTKIPQRPTELTQVLSNLRVRKL